MRVKTEILICETNDPLGPTKSIECSAEVDPQTGKLTAFVFPKGTAFEDIAKVMEVTSDPAWHVEIIKEGF